MIVHNRPWKRVQRFRCRGAAAPRFPTDYDGGEGGWSTGRCRGVAHVKQRRTSKCRTDRSSRQSQN